MPHLVIMAAGTGGHIMPGLAVARELQTRGWTVSWFGTTGGMENRLVPQAGIPLDTVAFSGMRGKGLRHAVTGAWRMVVALVHSWRVLGRRKADAVLGMGGYICLPGGLMAALRRTPLMLVNADAALLLSNKALLPWSDRIAFGFEGPHGGIRGAVVTGNPVRADIAAIPEPAVRYAGREGSLRLLVVGGSLGAQVLNEVVPQALALMPPDRRPIVVHQTGQSQYGATVERYAALGLSPDSAQLRPFIDDMAAELRDCDVVLCRAGAITVSELCAAGVPSMLVPLVLGTTAHQRDNARLMAEKGAAWHFDQAGLTAQALAQHLLALDRSVLLEMAQRARALSRPHAAARVADELERLVQAS